MKPLNPLDDPVRWERLVRSTVRAGEPHLEARRSQTDLATLVVRWARPGLSMAAGIVLLALGAVALRTVWYPGEPSLAEAQVSEVYAAWLIADYAPTAAEMIAPLASTTR